ncbi:Branched-chain alpha-keto acid dehydrogenase, E1 component, alpha subunit [Acidisarcina polymorpha]|uniref:Branched-chain alpha-keto acid dehydrogenase, E1 component, alpha subunit n=1 Tax=Acidisarcina polymorpha TaxID=2211140 RepID=A0A2Z5G7N7_9BACT|nr:thiamine pyrophosphate-dependent enzyme [Acidisarcina polymorpha]AXC15282.1 Branched-chain alpha-keto acid dehydrogenase, E1 component, alpha subunit [Acidisarcina polymorpha]
MATKSKSGTVTTTPPSKGASLISDAKLRQLHAMMLRCRMLEGSARRWRVRHEDGRRVPLPKAFWLRGREATLVGSAIDLRRDDWIGTSQPSLLPALIRGVPLVEIFSGEISDQLSHRIIPAAVPKSRALLDAAAGIALGMQAGNRGSVVMVFSLADRAEVLAHRALSYAADHQLPLIVVSVSAAARDKRGPQRSRDAAYPIIPVDGDDVIAMYRVAFESIHKARHSGGPTLIEAISSRTSGRTKPNAIRPEDPIVKLEGFMAAKNLFSAKLTQQITAKFDQEIALSMNTDEARAR